MNRDLASTFVTADEAVGIACEETKLEVSASDLQVLINLGLLPNFGSDDSEVLVLGEHIKLFCGRVATELEVAMAPLRAKNIPPGVDVTGHTLIWLAPNLGISFIPNELSISSLQGFIRQVRSIMPSDACPGGQERDTCFPIPDGPYIWASGRINEITLQDLWKLAQCREARTSAAESLCIPTFYGSKARVSSFVVSSIRQNHPEGGAVCDLMAGTGIITRQLLPYYTIHANDASLFGATMAQSQAEHLSEVDAESLWALLSEKAAKNFNEVANLLGPALTAEEDFLLGLSEEKIAVYREFANSCTRFVPEFGDLSSSSAWPTSCDALVRRQFQAQVERGRKNPRQFPYVLATAYWGNCYFGLKQSAEIDSLCFAIDTLVPNKCLPLIKALLLAAADACASGPHYAQPPQAKTDAQVRQIIERRAKSVFREFQSRLLLAPKRACKRKHPFSVTNAPWNEALKEFDKQNSGMAKAVYVDPPYSRLQYSRFYHVFDSLLRYDYPQCLNEGRTSERQKRFSSGFDCRQPTAEEEFRKLFTHLSDIQASMFLSYSTAGTVNVQKLLEMAQPCFPSLSVYTVPLQHHSQGVALKDRGHRTEVLIVGKFK